MARVRGSQIYSPEIMEELQTVMAEESRDGEDDEATFRQKLNALQRFLNHGMSRFSIELWHHALCDLFQTYRHHGQHEHRDADILTRLRGVADLRLLSRDVMLQRDGGSLRETDTQALKHLDNFLSALQCLREANKLFTDLYKFLYRYYYDPRIASAARSARLSRSASKAEQNAFETSAKQFGILTLEQMSGSSGHKLRRTVTDMSEILRRWEHIVTTEGEINPEDLDAESQQEMLLLAATTAFEPVLRLLPDMFAKFYKCLELAKQWWVLAHDIYPELPINRPPTPPTEAQSPSQSDNEKEGDDFDDLADEDAEEADAGNLSEKVPVSEMLLKVEDEILDKEDNLLSLQYELRVLEERERHFESLVEAYEKVTADLASKTAERKGLAVHRERNTFPPHGQMVSPRNDSNDRGMSDGQKLDEMVDTIDRQIQLLQFQQSLLVQDYMLQLEVRPSLIRFAEDLRQKTEAAQQSLTNSKVERLKLQTLIEEGENVVEPTVIQESQQDTSNLQNTDNELAEISASNNDKTVEKKSELSRLQDRQFLKDMTDNSIVSQDVEVTQPKAKATRTQSLPTRQKDSVNSNDANNSFSQPPETQMLKRPSKTDVNGKPTNSPGKSSMESGHQKGTEEPVLKRRASTKNTAEIAREKSLGQLAARPRAKSEPHVMKTGQKTMTLAAQPVTRRSSHDSNKQHTTITAEKHGPSIEHNTSSRDTKVSSVAAKAAEARKDSVTTHSDSGKKGTSSTADARKDNLTTHSDSGKKTTSSIVNTTVSTKLKHEKLKKPEAAHGQKHATDTYVHPPVTTASGVNKTNDGSSGQTSLARKKHSDAAVHKAIPAETTSGALENKKELHTSVEASQHKSTLKSEKCTEEEEGKKTAQKTSQARPGQKDTKTTQTPDTKLGTKSGEILEKKGKAVSSKPTEAQDDRKTPQTKANGAVVKRKR